MADTTLRILIVDPAAGQAPPGGAARPPEPPRAQAQETAGWARGPSGRPMLGPAFAPGPRREAAPIAGDAEPPRTPTALPFDWPKRADAPAKAEAAESPAHLRFAAPARPVAREAAPPEAAESPAHLRFAAPARPVAREAAESPAPRPAERRREDEERSRRVAERDRQEMRNLAAEHELVAQTAEAIARMREESDALRASLGDGTYLAQQKRLVELRREEAQLAKQAAREDLRARHGNFGAAVRTAAGRAASVGEWGAGAAQGAGAVARQLAANDAGGAATTAVGGVSTALAALGPVGAAAGVGLKAVTAGATAAAAAIDGFAARGRELGQFNGRLAVASAQADVTRMKADAREADALSGPLAELMEQQAAMEVLFREIMLPIKEVIVEGLSAFMALGKDAIVGLLEFLKTARVVPAAVSRYAERVLKALEKDKDPTQFIDQWLDAVNGLGPTAVAPDPIAGAAEAAIAPPILGFGG